MKTNFLFSLFLVVILGVILSCASFPPGPPIDPESFIGTKWACTEPEVFFMSLEIINDTECYYTLMSTRYHTIYTIKGNIITLPAVHTSYAVVGDNIYDEKGKLMFTKE